MQILLRDILFNQLSSRRRSLAKTRSRSRIDGSKFSPPRPRVRRWGTKVPTQAVTIHGQPYHATIYDIAVHPEYQRRGIGTRLMNELIVMLPV